MTNRAKTIDAAGNIIDKPYGVSRWANPRVRGCAHEGCEGAAVVLKTGNSCLTGAHNCCTNHDKEK